MSEIVLLSESEGPPTLPAEAAPSLLSPWRCPQCTYENPANYLVCDMCAQDRPDDTVTTAAPSNHEKQAPLPPPPLLTATVDLTGDDEDAAGPSSRPAKTNNAWSCPACTLINSGGVKVCEACGTPPLGAEAPPQNPQLQVSVPRGKPSVAAEEQAHGVYSLDCGCSVARSEAEAAVCAAASGTATGSGGNAALSALLEAFKCPAGCGRQLSHRDLEALLGSAAAAARVDRRIYRAAKKQVNGASTDLITSHCISLAIAVAQLHAAVASSAAGSSAVAAAAAASPSGRRKSGKRGKKRGRGSHYGGYHGHGQRDDSRAGGVGYGGGGGADDVARRRQLEEAAAERQAAADSSTATALKQLRGCLESLLADESASVLVKQCPPGWLPLGAAAVLQGGPLAPCLRLLLCNDSLMDVTARQEVFSEALNAVQVLARRQELVPLLLRAADGDVLATFSLDDEDEDSEEEEEEGEVERAAKRPRGTCSASAAPTAPNAEESSCWRALQAFQVQCDLFMRSAEDLAAGGSEGDVDVLGTVLLVKETAATVGEAVAAYKSATAEDTAAPLGQQQAQGDPRQCYVETMRPFAFRDMDLVDGGDYYFRSKLSAAPTGDAAARLRRLTKEIATLSGQLPIDWDSSIFVACDQHRLDCLRAVIIAPPGTPYAAAPFFFDVYLPPEYPSAPPKVQFLTTGGGRVRFNPNLYADGKVCLSLLGTWSGPGWVPGTSTLLQVLVSIQAMILGEPEPYGNEPGFAKTLKTPAGQRESQRYNAQQRANTASVALLPALQAGVPRGFEEVLKMHFRMKAADLKAQMGEWVRLDAEEEAREKAEASKGRGRGGHGGMFNSVAVGLQGLPGMGGMRGNGDTASRGMRRAAEQVCAALDALVKQPR